MTYCDTCGHQFSDVCGGCESLEGVPVKYKKKNVIDINSLERGCFYGVGTDGVFYKVFPRVKMPLAKKIDIGTGKIIYPTNADRIRNMTDEELAKWIDNNMCVLGHGCPCEKCEQPYKRPCDGAWLEWLKQEVKE